MAAVDITALRHDTPGCERVVHVNNAGASLMSRPVIDLVNRHLVREAEHGGYEAMDLEEDEAEGVYLSGARLLGCRPDELALFENATLAWRAVVLCLDFRLGDKILTSDQEYFSNMLAYRAIASRTGAEIVMVGRDEWGRIDVESIARQLDSDVKLVALTHMPTNSGVVNPVASVGAMTRQAGIPLLVDACQSVGQMPVDVEDLECDFLATAGRKFLRGPRGTGLLYARREWVGNMRPFMPEVGSTGWTMTERGCFRDGARRFETWEASWALRLGLGEAMDYACRIGLDWVWTRVSQLAANLRALLGSTPGVVLTEVGLTEGALVTFRLNGMTALAVKRRLVGRGINVDVVSSPDISGSPTSDDCVVRASVHYFNTEEELIALCEALAELSSPTALAS